MALSRSDFHDLIDEHAPALYRLAYRLVGDGHEAEDIVQETLRSAWSSRERFDQARLGAAGSGCRAWLASILRRRVVDRWRRAKRRPPAAGDHVLDVPVEAADPLANEYTDEMQAALGQLSPELRESLLLVVVGELTHQQAADSLGVPLGTVLSRVSRARRRLRQHLLAMTKGSA
ncbi:MAG: sigma-70 family RNA polymerase sigma factor [Planctomycetota bacterium]